MTFITIDKPIRDQKVDCPRRLLADVQGIAVIPLGEEIRSITVSICEPHTENCGRRVPMQISPPETSESDATYTWSIRLPGMNDPPGVPIWNCNAGGVANEIRAVLELEDPHENPDPKTKTFSATC